MRASRLVVVLSVALSLSLSLTVPAEDVPETALNESEALPHESTPLFSIVLQESAQPRQSAPVLGFPRDLDPMAQNAKILYREREQQSGPEKEAL